MTTASLLTRLLLTSYAAFCLLLAAPQAHAQDKVLRVGTLKLIHGIPLTSTRSSRPRATRSKSSRSRARPTARTRSSPARSISARSVSPRRRSARPPASRWSSSPAQCNRGMAVMAGVKSDIKTIKDLKGKKVAIWPGSTQEVVILERLESRGHDHQGHPADPAAVLRHGAGARARRRRRLRRRRAGPGISLANGVGRIVEYPYRTRSARSTWSVGERRRPSRRTPSS